MDITNVIYNSPDQNGYYVGNIFLIMVIVYIY